MTKQINNNNNQNKPGTFTNWMVWTNPGFDFENGDKDEAFSVKGWLLIFLLLECLFKVNHEKKEKKKEKGKKKEMRPPIG